MDRLSVGLWLGLAASGLVGCGRTPDPDALPRASDTLVEVGKRLGTALSPADLERLGSDETRLLRALTHVERLSLGWAYLRFRVDRPAIVDVAVPGGRIPFWLADAGFRPLGRGVAHPDGSFELWSRRFDAGAVGLGVNALDRRSVGATTSSSSGASPERPSSRESIPRDGRAAGPMVGSPPTPTTLARSRSSRPS